MATTSVPVSTLETNPRVLRGRELYREHADEITYDVRERVWYVPSEHDATSLYEVRIGRHGESCECADFEHRNATCKHIYAASLAKAKTASCSGCSRRFKHRDLVEVGDDSLTFFEADLLCRTCARDHGVL